MKNRLMNLWLKVQEPRALSAIYFFAYQVVAVAGAAVIIDPPHSIQSGIGAVLMFSWAGLLVFGGILGALTTLPGIWWLERAAALACMFAIVIYGVVVISLPLTQVSVRVLSICFVIFAILAFAVRLVKIRHSAYDPEQ
ncbi:MULTISPECIES: hypothetical protein [Arthrobacter]|uniref:Uncharacterized protein n=1 Tax=Arthrobacter terricola TaxID=2547396 RepID=A0A4R5KA40_9MICC|nr:MULTISPECIES: hypothetical protein [Arthrobacter]MBT8162787.1 hypothetical protein [Arthrobacter sp. GN70]TDF92053.1 hypothetical protein E1809_18915 [Arthrobacter terricola]